MITVDEKVASCSCEGGTGEYKRARTLTVRHAYCRRRRGIERPKKRKVDRSKKLSTDISESQ